MRRNRSTTVKQAWVVAGLAIHAFACAANPCSGIDRSLSPAQQRNYAVAIGQHLNQ